VLAERASGARTGGAAGCDSASPSVAPATAAATAGLAAAEAKTPASAASTATSAGAGASSPTATACTAISPVVPLLLAPLFAETPAERDCSGGCSCAKGVGLVIGVLIGGLELCFVCPLAGGAEHGPNIHEGEEPDQDGLKPVHDVFGVVLDHELVVEGTLDGAHVAANFVAIAAEPRVRCQPHVDSRRNGGESGFGSALGLHH
jgi:hypothetical protein